MSDKEKYILEGKRWCYALVDEEKDDDGNYVPVIIVENNPGYITTDYNWGKDLTKAQEIADDMNRKIGITPKEAVRLIFTSMRID